MSDSLNQPSTDTSSIINEPIVNNNHCLTKCNDSTCDKLLSNDVESYDLYEMCKKCPKTSECNITTMNVIKKKCDELCKNECNSSSFDKVHQVVLKCNNCPNTYKCNPESDSYKSVINNYYSNIENQDKCIQQCKQDNDNIQQNNI